MEPCVDHFDNEVEENGLKLKEHESERISCGVEVHKSLLEKKIYLEQSIDALYPEVYDRLTKRKEIEMEMEHVSAEIKRRDEEIVMLSSDLEKQPKMASRSSYIERIKEITKNSRKQDTGIQQILKDTRELQIESNSIQERLNRTYAVVDETISREAKKDDIARQAYRLLASVHESFERIAEKIIAADRSRRTIADYEAKLVVIDSRSLNIDKLQADLDAIRQENDLLDQRPHNLS